MAIQRRKGPWVAALLGWAVLVWVQTEPALYLATAVVVVLLLVGSAVAFLVALVYSLFARQWRLARYTWNLLAAVVSANIVASLISGLQQKASMRAAQPVIEAVERYRSATGALPEALDALVPEFLPAIPRTKMGLRGTGFWFHSTGETYRIGFALPAWMSCHYDSRTGAWRVHD